MLETFRTIKRIKHRYGVNACRRLIVSFTRSASDIAKVFELAELATGGKPPVLDVVPLFETQADLEQAVSILKQTLALAPVKTRGKELEVMLGYSDSAKEVGPVTATFALYGAQAEPAR